MSWRSASAARRAQAGESAGCPIPAESRGELGPEVTREVEQKQEGQRGGPVPGDRTIRAAGGGGRARSEAAQGRVMRMLERCRQRSRSP